MMKNYITKSKLRVWTGNDYEVAQPGDRIVTLENGSKEIHRAIPPESGKEYKPEASNESELIETDPETFETEPLGVVEGSSDLDENPQ